MLPAPNLYKNIARALLAGLAVAAFSRVRADPSEGIAVPQVKSGTWEFSFLPKAFQKDPLMEMTFYTELTPFGRMLRPASPENPVYYVAQAGGFRPMGWTTVEKPPRPVQLERAMTKALTNSGFLPAAPEHPATLALFYFWGSHYALPQFIAGEFRTLRREGRLEREELVGGRKFVEYMETGFGSMAHDENLEYLRYQAGDDLYFVVVAAFDYRALTRGERKLVWSTHMTANAHGLALDETMQPLVAGGAQFLGRETLEPAIGTRRISREGQVEIGTATVVRDKAPDVAAPGKTAAGK